MLSWLSSFFKRKQQAEPLCMLSASQFHMLLPTQQRMNDALYLLSADMGPEEPWHAVIDYVDGSPRCTVYWVGPYPSPDCNRTEITLQRCNLDGEVK